MADHYQVKQVIVMRHDINYGSRGKFGAQVAHCSLAPIMKLLQKDVHYIPHPSSTRYFDVWCQGSFAKIVLRTDSLDELYRLKEECDKRYIPCDIITDNGTTVFNEPTTVGIGIGPYESNELNEITGHLKLF
jgi:PTH2 family peptidyl-tRNA hydrolase